MVEEEARHEGREFAKIAFRELDVVFGLVEHLGRGELRLIAFEVRTGSNAHRGLRFLRGFAVTRHQRHRLVPDARHRLGEGRIVLQRLRIDDEGVLDFAGKLRRIEDVVGALLLEDFGRHRVPGDHRRHVRRGIGRDHVGIRGVDDGDVLFRHADGFEPARQRVVGDGEFDEIDLLALDVLKLVLALEDDDVVAVRIVAYQQDRRVDAAGGGNGKRIHVRRHHAVIGAGRELVDALDIVVELNELDIDVVLVGPLLHAAVVHRIAPGHPADIDRPGNLEVLFLFRMRGRQRGECKCRRSESRGEHSERRESE